MDIIFLTATCSVIIQIGISLEGNVSESVSCGVNEIECEIEIMNFNEFDKKFILLFLLCFPNAWRIILKE